MEVVTHVVPLVLFFFCSFDVASGGQYCMSCDDVPSARDCDTVKECGIHEVCYSTQYVSASGHIYRQLGCRDTRQCTSGIVHKRSGLRDVHDLPVCDGCCDTQWCQAKLCQDMQYRPDRGQICFDCPLQSEDENCTKIRECGRDDVCYESFARSPNAQLIRRTGCYGKHLCDRIITLGHISHNNHSCWNCCVGDICNTGCGMKMPAAIHPSTAGVVIHRSTSPTPAACIDSTPHATCQLASSIVCKDQKIAQNANCMHYCGYC